MSEPITRRATLTGIAAAAAGAALPRIAGAADPLRVGLVPIWDVAPFYAATEQGYFAAENVAATPQIIRGGAAALPAMVSGSLDIIYANGVSLVQAITRGIDVRILMEGAPAGASPPDPGALLKRKGDPFKTGKDYEGKIIAVNALRDVQWMLVMAWVKATGGDPDKVQIVELPIPAMVEAIKAKRVDGAFVLDPFMTAGLADPAIDMADWVLSRVYANGPVGFFATTPQLTQTRGPELRSFMRAYKRGVTWVNANAGKEPFYAFIAGFTGINVDVVKKMINVPAHAELTPNTFPRLTSLMTQTGLLTTTVDLRTKIFT